MADLLQRLQAGPALVRALYAARRSDSAHIELERRRAEEMLAALSLPR